MGIVAHPTAFLPLNTYCENFGVFQVPHMACAGFMVESEVTTSEGKKKSLMPWYLMSISENMYTTETKRLSKAISVEVIDQNTPSEKIEKIIREKRLIVVKGAKQNNTVVHQDRIRDFNDFVLNAKKPEIKPLAVKLTNPIEMQTNDPKNPKVQSTAIEMTFSTLVPADKDDYNEMVSQVLNLTNLGHKAKELLAK